MNAEIGAPLYVVQRRNWARQRSDGIVRLIRLPGSVRLASFDSEADALAECARLEEQARRAVNPFCCDGAGLHYQSHLDDGRLRDFLLDAGIDPPPPGETWIDWWQRIKDSLDAFQWHHAWKALDRLVFHEVTARPRKPVVYVVAEIDWTYNDYSYDPRPEGAVPRKAFRSRQNAEAERRRREVEARDDYDEPERLELEERLARAQPFAAGPVELPEMGYSEEGEDLPSLDYPLMFEVIEVELDEQAHGESAPR